MTTSVSSRARVPSTIGQYGQALHPQPYLSGGKISFKFTENFEFAMSKTTIYGGPGNPLTIKTFLAEHIRRARERRCPGRWTICGGFYISNSKDSQLVNLIWRGFHRR